LLLKLPRTVDNARLSGMIAGLRDVRAVVLE
jgi:hypothetical protein